MTTEKREIQSGGGHSGGSAGARDKETKGTKGRESQGEGRGWHGDPEGHAEAGRQSHKNDTP